MPAFGSFSLLVALVLSAYCLVAGAVSLRLLATGGQAAISPERLAETARRAGIGSFAAASCAAFALVWAAFTNDFSVAYILQHSNRALPTAYKFAALWSGQEGSLLLWAWLLTAFGFVLRMRHKVDVTLTAYASTILAGIQVFFFLLVNFPATPFSLVTGAVPPDGNGLNPLLQYPEMVIHPPMLYLGYVGFSVPFAFALGALMMRYPGEKWIHITRRWTMVTWLFLTVGIFLGMHWAYNVLGWGGYWGWDPVENASLMPWLTGTAFLHSVMMQEKRGMMKSWNAWLIFSTFLLAILGTLLTRSGLVSSVHAFAQSAIGTWFWVFLVIVLAICTFTFILQRDHLKAEHHLESLVSRESSFAFNNLVLLVACFTILWGTLFPVLSEYVQGYRVTVSAPWYNRIGVPVGVFLLFLTGIGPLLAWRSTSMRSIRRNFVIPGIAALVIAIVSIPLGVHPWTIFTTGEQGAFYAWITFALAAFVITAIFAEFFRGARVIQRHTGQNLLASVIQLTRRNTRRYGGYIVHFGVVLIFIGFAGQAFNTSKQMTMNYKQSMFLGPYRIECEDFSQDTNANYDTTFAMLNVYDRGGKLVTKLAPELRFYQASQQPQTMVANYSTPAWDLYVIFAGTDPATGQPVVKAFLNPLVMWIWIGLLITVFGTLIALVPNLSAALAAQKSRVAAAIPQDVVAAGKAGD
ncbi:MAG TPA: cytochrome c-type biogenesis CcmF C-terminal domain-containing protein [Acidobacteriaceae bacterium]|nr:cytochrome c-type biogenesis CcmF C-terminal domain-containing protein [Acidobacteriaceae bacterium]